MRRLIPLAMSLILILTACGGGSDPDDGGESVNPIGEGDTADSGDVIRWDESPSHVIFRAEYFTREQLDDFFIPMQIPECTIYGDQRVVWTVDASDPAQGVLVGDVDGRTIRNFVSALTYEGFFTYEAAADLQSVPISPTVRQMTLSVNGQSHTADEYGNWPTDYFDEFLEYCRTLSTQPRVFQPTGLWVRVLEVEYNTNEPSILWDSDVTGLNLAEVASSGEPKWVTDRLARLLWGYSRRAPMTLQYSEDGRTYILSILVPYVSRGAPPAPEDEN